ncbi:MAG TPA: DUF2917 domain-containing protein [Anaerolineaceae bacterium]|jgi:hypothetical protein
MKTNTFSLPAVHSSQQQANRPAAEVRIGTRSLYRLQGDHRGERIDVVAGLVWVTQPGDGADHLLQPGESLMITRPGTVIAEGMTESVVRVSRQK